MPDKKVEPFTLAGKASLSGSHGRFHRPNGTPDFNAAGANGPIQHSQGQSPMHSSQGQRPVST